MNEAIIATVGAAVGFLAKSLWDYYSKRKLEEEKQNRSKRIEFLEKQLTHFYWPLLFQLRKNDVVWKRVLQNDDVDDELAKELNHKIERNFFYPSNQKMLEIVEGYYYLAKPPKDLDEQILRFIRHQAVFQGIRESLTEDVDPIRFGEPWPIRFSELVEAETLKLQEKYDRLLNMEIAEQGVDPNA